MKDLDRKFNNNEKIIDNKTIIFRIQAIYQLCDNQNPSSKRKCRFLSSYNERFKRTPNK